MQSARPATSLAEALGADAVGSTSVILPHDQRQVEVPVYIRSETPWVGDLPANFGAVPNKTPYRLDGAPHYPELLVVRLLEAAGWNAVWHKTWNGDEYWTDIRQPMDLPPSVASVVDELSRHTGHGGQWDLIAWRARQLRFLTSRPAGGQLVTAYQAAWLSVALRTGLPLGCFGVVEHRVTRSPRRRRLEHVRPA